MSTVPDALSVQDRALSSLLLLDTVGLDELVGRAALLNRVDRKYLVPLPVADDLVASLTSTARALEIDGRRTFAYSSQYLDTDDLASYHLAARARRHRYKVRSRTYLDSGVRFAEVKTRGARGTTVKERLLRTAGEPLGPQDHEGFAFVQAVLDRHGFLVAARTLRPTLRTRYDRSTLLMSAEGTRVTIDTRLTWSLPHGQPAGSATWRSSRRRGRGSVRRPPPAAGRSQAGEDVEVRHRPRRPPPGPARQPLAPQPRPSHGLSQEPSG